MAIQSFILIEQHTGPRSLHTVLGRKAKKGRHLPGVAEEARRINRKGRDKEEKRTRVYFNISYSL